jgi:acid stress chaperone HdeB
MSLVALRLCKVRILLANLNSGARFGCGRLDLAPIAAHLSGRKRTAMRFFAVLSVVGGLLAQAPAMAEDIDLSAWTCKQFLSAGKEDVGVILAWLDGYYKEEDEPPVIDTAALVVKAKKLGQYCAEHPDSDLISATDKLFQRE